MRGNINRIVENIKTGIKTYGFITNDEGTDYFFHKSDLKNCNIKQLEEGDVVEFEVQTGSDGRNHAISIRKMFQAASEQNVATPGTHPFARLEHFNDDEKKIIDFLEKIFYITSGGGQITIGGSTYRYCLIKPTDYFNKTFHLTREFVVIFSDYISFEPRSLDAVSVVYQRIESKLRLDRGCYIMICHDQEIETKLVGLLKDSNVNQIIVPFSYKELLENNVSANIVKERFKKYLFDTDLFSAIGPIQNDVFFFGRRDFVHDIVSKCKNSTNSGVFGLRRSGKTSLLYAIQNLLRQQGYPTVFIPCESDLSSLHWQTALYKVVLDVYHALNINSLSVREDNYSKNSNVTINFEKDMDAVLADITVPVTMMFDEIEAITFNVIQDSNSSNLWVDGNDFVWFWNTIKGYYSKNPQNISILVAGTNPMINEVPIIGEDKVPNPMFRQLSESNQGAYLPAFSIDDTNNMVNTLGGYMGLTFNEYAIAKLTSDCGGHPYLMRILCSHINKFMRTKNIARPAVVSKSIYDKALPDFEKSGEAISFFWMVLNILMTSYPKEFNTLKILALQGDEIVSQIQNTEALFHLIGYGLVECNQNNYAIKYTTITRFLRGEYRFEQQGLTIEEQKEEIQLRINNVEIQLRKLVKNTLLATHGTASAKALIISAMKENQAISSVDIEKANNLNYSQLFDASMNKMYFSLLMGIILQNFADFKNVFELCDEETIRSNLSVINIARRCPDHSFTQDSQNWSWDKFCKFRIGITWLEKILKEYE